MTRQMFDAVTLASIPPNPPMVGCYVDGLYANVDEARSRFPNARIVTITVNGRNRADVVDQEQGDCTPQTAVAAVKNGTAHTIYTSASTVAAVLQQFDAQGVSRSTPIWTAHYTSTPHICGAGCYGPVPFTPHVVATQYLGDFHGYDESLVADYWPGIDPAPTPEDEVTPADLAAIKAAFLQVLGYEAGDIEGEAPNSLFGQHALTDDVRQIKADLAAIKQQLGIS